ncbi:unnamed protein product [Ixodes hexagonus]
MLSRNGMGDGAQLKTAFFRVAEFSNILDWRPMLFQEPIVAQRACALCGVVYKKAVRLPCVHTLCAKCHAQCVDNGSACPVDREPFCEKDVEKLEISAEYILNRKVACWNAPRGCCFIGPAASLLDHYKECNFSEVSCCLCRASVLQSDILEHFGNGCNIGRATCGPAEDSATEDLKDVKRACLEMKGAMGKISEDIMSLQTSLNRCREEVRVEAARCKDQSKADAPRLTGQLNELSTICTTGFAKLQTLEAAMGDYKKHVSKELRSHSQHRPKRVHWYVENWADLKKQALEGVFKSLSSPGRSVHDYTVSQLIELQHKDSEVRFGCFLRINQGYHDSQLEWPFRKVYRVGVIHPKDQSKVISREVNPAGYEDQAFFQKPKGKYNQGFGFRALSTAATLEEDGFIQNGVLHLFLEIEP